MHHVIHLATVKLCDWQRETLLAVSQRTWKCTARRAERERKAEGRKKRSRTQQTQRDWPAEWLRMKKGMKKRMECSERRNVRRKRETRKSSDGEDALPKTSRSDAIAAFSPSLPLSLSFSDKRAKLHEQSNEWTSSCSIRSECPKGTRALAPSVTRQSQLALSFISSELESNCISQCNLQAKCHCDFPRCTSAAVQERREGKEKTRRRQEELWLFLFTVTDPSDESFPLA